MSIEHIIVGVGVLFIVAKVYANWRYLEHLSEIDYTLGELVEIERQQREFVEANINQQFDLVETIHQSREELRRAAEAEMAEIGNSQSQAQVSTGTERKSAADRVTDAYALLLREEERKKPIKGKVISTVPIKEYYASKEEEEDKDERTEERDRKSEGTSL